MAEQTSVSGQIYKREPIKRVFVNRSLMLERVNFFGFDMDYTLAMYKSPEYETLGFDHLKNKLVDMGYPEEIRDFEYDQTFPIRGLFFDRQYGTLLKVDGFGNILVCVLGFQFLKISEIFNLYPSKFVHIGEGRFRIFNTLYELPVIYLLACLIDFFISQEKYVKLPNGVKFGDMTMTYESIYNDLETAMEYVHHQKGPLKTDTMKDVEKYVVKDDRLPLVLSRLRGHNRKVFLATNSDYMYSNVVMSYLFDTESNKDKQPWTSFFDFIIVDAKKPLFFSQGTVIREVNKETGALRLGSFTGKVKPGAVYSGGSSDMITSMMGAEQQEVLYTGDHIFGDILKSKKQQGWRTFLVVPEMISELSVWTQERHLFSRLSSLDGEIAEIYRNLDSSDTSKPDISSVHANIRNVTHEMDQSYGKLGSCFRSGSRQTFFASQVMRYADLYAPSFSNMLHYPLTYCFRAPPMLMPHESTVDHEASITEDQLTEITQVWRSRVSKEGEVDRRSRLQRKESVVPRLFCEPPQQLNEIADDFLDTD